MLLWVEFIACTVAIVFAGARLSRYGDIIAEKTGLGRTWIGVVLLATVTSLPELVTGISSVTYAGFPDIAVGDVLGSCVFNLLILAILDAMYKPMPISARPITPCPLRRVRDIPSRHSCLGDFLVRPAVPARLDRRLHPDVYRSFFLCHENKSFL